MIKKLLDKLFAEPMKAQLAVEFGKGAHVGFERAMKVVERANNVRPDCFWVVFWSTEPEEEARYVMDEGKYDDHYQLFDNEDEATEHYEGLLVAEMEPTHCVGMAPVKLGSEPHWVGDCVPMVTAEDKRNALHARVEATATDEREKNRLEEAEYRRDQ